MCLHSIQKKTLKVSEGYKVFRRALSKSKGHYSLYPEYKIKNFKDGLPKRRWINRQEPPVELGNNLSQVYPSGFHVYINVQDAVKHCYHHNQIIHRVLIKNIIVSGLQNSCGYCYGRSRQKYSMVCRTVVATVVVCKQIYIMEEFKKNSLNLENYQY